MSSASTTMLCRHSSRLRNDDETRERPRRVAGLTRIRDDANAVVVVNEADSSIELLIVVVFSD